MTLVAGDCSVLGRDTELERLRRAWRRAQRSHGQVVLLSGEPGVGKTTLARHLAAEAAEAGAIVLSGRAEERPGAQYQPLADALRGALATAAVGFLDRGRQLRFVLPELGEPAPASSPLLMGQPGTDREELFDAVGDLLVEISGTAPVVLLLDDLHWADRTTVLLLDRVVDAVRQSPVLVIGCWTHAAVDRSHPLSVLIDSLTDDPAATSICLDGLGPKAVAAMVADPDLASALSRRGDGNPLYVNEVLRDLRDCGYLRADGSLDPAADVDADLLPRTTDDVVSRRVMRLRPATRRLLAVAAAIARPFEVGLVAATREVRADRLAAAAAEAVAAGLLEPADDRACAYRFPHPVLRQAVYRRLPSSTRVRLHRRVAEALETTGAATGADVDGARLAELACHFCAASPVGRSETAAHYAAAAGDHAMSVLAYEAAATHYGQALALLEHSATSSWLVRCNLLLALGEAQRQALEPARARQAFLEAVTAAEAHNSTELVARLQDALATVEPETAPAAGDVAGGAATGPPAGNRAIELASRRGDSLAVGALLRARHVRTWGPEDVDDRLRAADDVIRMAEQHGDRELAAQAHGWRMIDLMELGRTADADRDLAAHAALATALGHPAIERDAALFAAMRAALEGRAADARVAIAEVRAAGDRARDPQAAGLAARQQFWLDLEWGDDAASADLLRSCRRLAASPDPAGAWRASVALCLARSGHLGGAAIELARVSRHDLGARPHGPAWLAAVTCVAESAWLLADPRWTPLLAPPLGTFAGRLIVLEQGLACLGSTARFQALLSAAARRWAEASRYFEEAVETHSRIGALPLLARTHYEWAVTLLRRGRRSDVAKAGTALHRAAELGSELGMRRLSYEARTRLKSA